MKARCAARRADALGPSPMRGTILDHPTLNGARSPVFACEEELSHESTDAQCRTTSHRKDVLVIGAIAGW